MRHHRAAAVCGQGVGGLRKAYVVSLPRMQEEREATDAPPSLEEGASSGAGEEALAKAAPSAVTRWADYCFDVRDVTYDNRVVLLRDGRDAFPAMLNAIDFAERTVCLETYILEQDA